MHRRIASDFVKLPIWKRTYHKSGFWRFDFCDGGILDWDTRTGKMIVKGDRNSSSYKDLRPKTFGKIHGPARSAEEARRKLDSLITSVSKYFPNDLVQVPVQRNIGWLQKSTLWGEKFFFTDGGILCCYPSTGELAIEGQFSVTDRDILEKLCSLVWRRVDMLADTLRHIFPHWEQGLSLEKDEEFIRANMQEMTWIPLENALNWLSFWPEDRQMRLAANHGSPCQREFLKDLSSILLHHEGKKHLLAQAPTGIGKTLTSLVPALAWVAQAPKSRHIYYLVNRTAQHDNPIRELKVLESAFFQHTGQQLRVVDLVGRKRLCLNPQKYAGSCEEAGKNASWDHLPRGVASWREVQTHLRSRGLCPYHMLKKLMPQAHVVICDYWWLFSQGAQEQRLMQQIGFSAEHSIIIVDEAHNLPNRVRGEFSIDLSLDEINAVLASISEPILRQRFQSVISSVAQTPQNEDIKPSQLLQKFGGQAIVSSALDDLLEAQATVEESQALIPERILRMLLQLDKNVAIYPGEDLEGKKKVCFRLINPTSVLAEAYDRAYASLSMSGTLAVPADNSNELRYHLSSFALPNDETVTRVYASPFPLTNQKWLFTTDVCGIFSRRQLYVQKYVEHIKAIGKVTPGVTAVFFSSYPFRDQIYEAISDKDERDLVVTEEQNTGKSFGQIPKSIQDYKQLLDEKVKIHQRAYIFAVYTGNIAEGADFSENLIKSVICVSIPLEHHETYHERLAEFHHQNFLEIAEEFQDDAGKKAEEYAWYRSSLSLSLQACGRGIRDEDDRCVFVLLDERYKNPQWRDFLDPPPFNVPQPQDAVASFFRDHQVEEGDVDWDEALLLEYRKRDI